MTLPTWALTSLKWIFDATVGKRLERNKSAVSEFQAIRQSLKNCVATHHLDWNLARLSEFLDRNKQLFSPSRNGMARFYADCLHRPQPPTLIPATPKPPPHPSHPPYCT